MSTMTAVASFTGLPIDDPDALQDVEVPIPDLRPHDVLVRVEAVAVNPVDIKRRGSLASSTTPVILGFDAAGVIEAVGPEVSTLAIGDEVWYAGDVSRQGTNAEFHAVDERIVARKPKSLSFKDSAALPLTTITAWETLFERFALTADSGGDLLVLGAAGGVGSVMIQLAKRLTGVRVIATASRDDSRAWVVDLGADAVIDHHDLQAQALEVAASGVDYVFSPHSAGNIDIYAAITKPFGHITAVDEPDGLDLLPLKAKSIAWHWELMFTRALCSYDMIAQQRLLSAVADMVDRGEVRSTVTTAIHDFSASGLREAHRLVESGRMIGKVVVYR
ncbi:zinc-binding alcohol dehydrogenase family protein [Mycolicibacterium mucogenicum]|uniref:zinc-binding alcohol dehydrogenase family protein n=1 Tax=Mycolicibacterium mucogenicum TaxID=56689 RepID=UPI00226A8CCA|nr:zinc-binding alcohol dehydrogenase family protein [Mycolicibacterium mucogenicum]MCX8564349.1 zinc-binding alcohol dehydrogenase family protein [Mycolicibacterium mucogenicum]